MWVNLTFFLHFFPISLFTLNIILYAVTTSNRPFGTKKRRLLWHQNKYFRIPARWSAFVKGLLLLSWMDSVNGCLSVDLRYSLCGPFKMKNCVESIFSHNLIYLRLIGRNRVHSTKLITQHNVIYVELQINNDLLLMPTRRTTFLSWSINRQDAQKNSYHLFCLKIFSGD